MRNFCHATFRVMWNKAVRNKAVQNKAEPDKVWLSLTAYSRIKTRKPLNLHALYNSSSFEGLLYLPKRYLKNGSEVIDRVVCNAQVHKDKLKLTV